MRSGSARRCLITGGAGFIGSHLVDALVAGGDQVTVLDDLSTGSLENLAQWSDAEAVEIVEGSTRDEALVDELVQSNELVLPPGLRRRSPADRRPSARIAAGQRTRHRARSLRGRSPRAQGRLHVHVGGLRQELDRSTHRGRRPCPGLPVQVPLGIRDREGLRRGARARPVPGARHACRGGEAVQLRRAETDRPVRDGASALRPAGARRRRHHGVRQRHSDALLRARRRHGAGAAAARRASRGGGQGIQRRGGDGGPDHRAGPPGD